MLLLQEFHLFFAILLGLLIGSFLNVVIYRLPIILERQWAAEARELLNLPQETLPVFNLMKPASRCGNCGAPVRAWQNIPVISWLVLRGKCYSCKTPISMRYPLVELLTAMMFGLMAWQYGGTIISIGACLFTAIIVALIFIDADTQILPDELTLPLIWFGLLFNWYTGFVSLPHALWGAVIGYLCLWSLYWSYKLLTGKEGMGYGDFKLLSAIGAWLGASVLPIVVLFASLVGIVAALIMRVAKEQQMAFGPCLAVGGWLTFLCHDTVIKMVYWWLNKSGF